jgi:S-adenosylmethionine:tRNA ribosyltransferase-isomerase
VRAATATRARPVDERVLAVDPAANAFWDGRVVDFPRMLRAGDLVVVNDARTIPASLFGEGPRGEALEARLAGATGERCFRAVLFGEGDWRTKTEDRPPPPRVRAGDALRLAGLAATVASVLGPSPRLVELRFEASTDAMWRAIHAHGRYVQYAYSSAAREAWDAQTPFAGPPWASEMPSAGRALRFSVLGDLEAAGVRLARITHAAGLSSTGDEALDAALPLPERYSVPTETVAEIARAKAAGGRVVAIGTTVVRALEGAALAGGGVLRAHEGTTDLVLGPRFRRRVVDGIFTGLHERGATHFALLGAFAPQALLDRAYDHADAAGYLCHELGDASLVLDGVGR